MVVHGIPGPYELGRGDILSIDVGVMLDGWVADAAITVPVGPITPVAQRLLDTTRAVAVRRRRAVPAGQPPRRHLARRPEAVEADGFSVIRSLVGHGIGRDMHEDPQIPNFGEPGTGPELEEGMVLAIEPMVNVGSHADPHGARQLVGLLPGRLAGRPLRVHGRDHRRRAADPHSLARGRGLREAEQPSSALDGRLLIFSGCSSALGRLLGSLRRSLSSFK